jgi:hypothetical protein
MTKKEEFKKWYYFNPINSENLWSFIESEIRRAKIDENKYWEKEFITSNFKSKAVIASKFIYRIKELESQL